MAKSDSAGSLRGVILDVDGTLIDSNDAHAKAWQDALREQDIEISFEAVRPLIGMGGDKLLPTLTGVEEDTSLGKRISERRSAIFRERYLPHLQAFPDTRELLESFKDRGLKLAVATSAKDEDAKAIFRRIGIEDLLDSSTSSDDADASKPDPDIVEAAIKKIGLPRETLIMLGDTPYDMEAATRAKVRFVAVECGGWEKSEFPDAEAVYKSPQDLLARLDDSPFHTSSDRKLQDVGAA